MKAIFLILKSRLRGRKLLNCLIISLIAISVSVLIIALSLSNGFESGILNKIISFSSQINVVSEGNPDFSNTSKDFSKNIRIRQIQALAINPVNQATQGIILKGTNIKSIPDLLNPEYLLTGKYPSGQEILIGGKLAENFGAGIGDSIQILADPASFISLKISGIFKVGLYEYDSGIVITPDKNIVDLVTDSTLSNNNSYYGIWLKSPEKAKDISRKILSLNPGITVTNWLDDNKALVEAISIEKGVIFVVLSLLLIISSLSISISQIIHILNQSNQIGILSAIGFIPSRIFLLYSLEGLLLGCIGVLSGIIFGLIAIWYLANYPINLPINVYHINNLPISLKVVDIVWVSAIAIIFSVIASIIPAIYASKLNPAEILRR